MSIDRSNARVLAAAVAVVAVLLLAQLGAAVSAPPSGLASTGRVLGKTGFAYIGGIRTFVAAALWNRLDPQFHEYYGGTQLHDLDFMMPTMRLVVALDPQFTQAYQVSSFIIFQKMGHDEGLAIAREGVANNPRSGSMRSNLAQLLLLDDPAANRTEALENARAVLSPDIVWASEADEYEGLAITRGVLVALDQDSGVQGIQARLAELRTHPETVGDHDHDHDGKQDH